MRRTKEDVEQNSICNDKQKYNFRKGYNKRERKLNKNITEIYS